MATFQIVAPTEANTLLRLVHLITNSNSEVVQAYGKRSCRKVDYIKIEVVAEDDDRLYRLTVNRKFLGAFPLEPNDTPDRRKRLTTFEGFEKWNRHFPKGLSPMTPELYSDTIVIARQHGSIWGINKGV